MYLHTIFSDIKSTDTFYRMANAISVINHERVFYKYHDRPPGREPVCTAKNTIFNKKKKNRFVLLHAYVFVEIYTIYIEKFNTNDFARVYVGERATV